MPPSEPALRVMGVLEPTAALVTFAAPLIEQIRVGAVIRRDAEHRQTLLAGLSGTVMEVGAGNGLNFAHYPPEVTGVLAVEPEPLLRGIAADRVADTAVAIQVIDGDADQLPARDGSLDAVVASLVLCSVPDPDHALAEMFRVLKPGGRLRFFEHVQARTPGKRTAQRVLDVNSVPGRTADSRHRHPARRRPA